MKCGRLDNRGLTLVEMLVSLAILSVVMVSAFGFLFFSTNNYNRSNTETNLQSEAQLVINRLESMIVNATSGVGCKIDGTSGTDTLNASSELYVYHHVYNPTTDTMEYRKISVFQGDEATATGQKLMYQYDVYALDTTGGSGGMVPTTSVSAQPISDFVEDFSVDLSKLTSNNEVTVTLKLKSGVKSYETTNTFFLRNEVAPTANGSVDDYFKNEAVADKKNNVNSVTVSEDGLRLWQGTTHAYTASIKDASNNEIPDASLYWRVSGNSDPNTTIDAGSGFLTIGKNETATSLIVSATAVSSIGSADGERTGTAHVLVKSVNSLTLTKPVGGTGNYMTATVTVDGKNFEPAVDLAYLLPAVSCTGNLPATVTAYSAAECSENALRYTVMLTRPQKPKGSYTLTAVTTVASSGHSYQDSQSFSFEGSVRNLEDADLFRTDVTENNQITNAVVRVDRGSSLNVCTNGSFSDGTTAPLLIGTEKEQWVITNVDELNAKGITLTQEMVGETMTYRMDIAPQTNDGSDTTKSVTVWTKYQKTDGTAEELHFTLQFKDPKPAIEIADVGNQVIFPLTKGLSESMTINVYDMPEGSYIIKCESTTGGNTVKATIEGNKISFKSDVEIEKSEFTITLCDTSGTPVKNVDPIKISLKVRQSNTKDKNGQMESNGFFIPEYNDARNFDSSQKPLDTDGATLTLHRLNGSLITYTYHRKGNDGRISATYNGKLYKDNGNTWQNVSSVDDLWK